MPNRADGMVDGRQWHYIDLSQEHQALSRSRESRGRIPAALLMSLLAGGLAWNPPARAEATYVRDGTFDRSTVTELARSLSRSPFAPPKAPLPKVLADLDYDHYRDIRVRPSSTLWADKGTEFRLQLLLVAGGRCQRITYKPDLFVTGDVMKAALPKEDIGFSGFRVLFPINRRSVFDEVAVFQGASYFRSHGHHLDPAYDDLALHVVYMADDGASTALYGGGRLEPAGPARGQHDQQRLLAHARGRR